MDWKVRALETIAAIARTLWSYLRGQFLVMLIMMGLYAIGFRFAEVPLWFLVAIVCGFLHLIPLMGALLGVLIPVAFALFGGGGLHQILKIVAVFAIAQLLETFYLTPRILGRELRLSPLLVFLSVKA